MLWIKARMWITVARCGRLPSPVLPSMPSPVLQSMPSPVLPSIPLSMPLAPTLPSAFVVVVGP